MSETLSHVTPEQLQTPDQPTKWDTLANPNESWEYHLKKAKELTVHERSKDKERKEEDAGNSAKELIKAMDNYRFSKESYNNNIFRNQRGQEFFERQLNARMDTHLEELETLSEVPGSGVIKTEIIGENGTKIELINLDGYPLRFIQHAIDYKDTSGNKGMSSYKTSILLQENPSLWDKKESEVEFSWGGNNPSKGNVISTSYINLGNDESVDKRMKSKCAYGWTKFQPMSVVDAGLGDIRAGNQYGKKATIGEAGVRFVDGLDQPQKGSLGAYNEVVVRRYNEAGRPFKPEFIIVDNKHDDLSVAKKHAEYFGVPIIRINEEYGDRSARNKLLQKEQEGTLTEEDRNNLNLYNYIGHADLWGYRVKEDTIEAINLLGESINKNFQEMNKEERDAAFKILDTKSQFLKQKWHGMRIDLGDLSKKIKLKADVPFVETLKDMEVQVENIGREQQ